MKKLALFLCLLSPPTVEELEREGIIDSMSFYSYEFQDGEAKNGNGHEMRFTIIIEKELGAAENTKTAEFKWENPLGGRDLRPDEIEFIRKSERMLREFFGCQ